MSLIDPTNEPAEMGVPPAPRYSSMSSRGGLIPLVLQVSPLDDSPGPDEFFYDPFANVDSGDFCGGTCLLHQQWPCRRLPRLS